MKALTRYQIILLGEQRHIGVNNLPKVVARQCSGCMGIELMTCPSRVQRPNCCCCDSPAALLLSSVVQHCELRRMALTVEQMLYGVWCHSTLRTNIWYTAGDAGLVTVQKPTVTRTQLGKCGMDWPRQQTFKRWDVGWWSSKDSGTKFVFASCRVSHVRLQRC